MSSDSHCPHCKGALRRRTVLVMQSRVAEIIPQVRDLGRIDLIVVPDEKMMAALEAIGGKPLRAALKDPSVISDTLRTIEEADDQKGVTDGRTTEEDGQG